MKKAELVASMREIMGFEGVDMSGKAVDAALFALAGSVRRALTENDSVRVPGLGTFAPVGRPARKGRNPQTGQEIDIAATTAIKFKPAKELREAVAAS